MNGAGPQGWTGPPPQRRPMENPNGRGSSGFHNERPEHDTGYDRAPQPRYRDEHEVRRPVRRPAYDDYEERPRRRPAPAPPRQRRKVWPWVLLGIVLVPVLGVVGCMALLGGAVSAVDQARQGGTVAIGETFSYQSGLSLSVSAPAPYTPSSEFLVSDGNTAYETTVTISNGSPDPVSTALVLTNATVNNAPASEVYDENSFPTQDIAPGQALAIPFRFQVPDGTTGPLQIAVTGTFNEPVFFTGQLS